MERAPITGRFRLCSCTCPAVGAPGRLDRERAERRQKKEEEVARRKAEQPALFDF